MSFSTPMATEKEPEKPKRRTSRRISGEAADEEKAPLTRLRESSGNAPVSKKQVPSRAKQLEKVIDPATSGKTSPGKSDTQRPDAVPEPEATRIALPFADTPVIRRNKAMRQAQDGKTERRSSLGMRGRRASSLIGSGSSNGKSCRPQIQRNALLISTYQLYLIRKSRLKSSTNTLRVKDSPNQDE